MLSKLDKEIVFGRILVKKLIRHIMLTNLDAGFVCTSWVWNNRLVRKKLKSMWGIAWGIKIRTSVYEVTESPWNTDIIDYLNGSGERIRTSDLRVMSLTAISKINTLGLFWMHKDAQSSLACTKNVQRLFAFFHALFALGLIRHWFLSVVHSWHLVPFIW